MSNISKKNKNNKNKNTTVSSNKSMNKVKDGYILRDGEVLEILSNGMFKVQLLQADNKKSQNPIIVLANPSGKMRLNKIRIIIGDIVKVEVSEQDKLNPKGRITYRYKDMKAAINENKLNSDGNANDDKEHSNSR